MRASDWAHRPLLHWQKVYAALDAWILLELLGRRAAPNFFLGVTSISILSRDPDLSRKPLNTLGKWLVLKRTMADKNGESTPRIFLPVCADLSGSFSTTLPEVGRGGVPWSGGDLWDFVLDKPPLAVPLSLCGSRDPMGGRIVERSRFRSIDATCPRKISFNFRRI